MTLFLDRLSAGTLLVHKIEEASLHPVNPIVLGIPRGGIPIGAQIAQYLRCPLDAIILRKLPIPNNPEMGFGAITLNRAVVKNESLLTELGLSDSEIHDIENHVYQEVLRRNKVYRNDRPAYSVKDRSVIITDDGLATGYTMLAAVESAQKQAPKEVIVACPVAHRFAYQLVAEKADKVIIPVVSDAPLFAVASYYQDFSNMSDSEVSDVLRGA